MRPFFDLLVHYRGHQLGLGHERVRHARLALESPDAPPGLRDGDSQLERIARNDWFPEPRVVDAHEIDDLVVDRGRLEGEHPPDLRHGLDYQHARHYGVAGEVPEEERLVYRDVLQAPGGFADVEVEDPVYKEKGVPVRKDRLDLFYIY